MLHQNSKFLKIWYIVTFPDDKDTINLVSNSEISNIKLLYYNDFYKDALFDKGGAIRYAQEYLLNNYESCNVLILDSDIYLPNNFNEMLITIKDDVLYSCIERIDYNTLYDFINNINGYKNYCGDKFIGYFQLYKLSNKYKYNKSYDCGKCDNYFRDLFDEKVNLNIKVKHLGNPNENWKGRDKNNDIKKLYINKFILNNRLNKYK
jgi:hypothetical protein